MGTYMDFPKKSCKKNCTFFAPIDPPIDRKAYTLKQWPRYQEKSEAAEISYDKKIYILPLLLLLLYTINSS